MINPQRLPEIVVALLILAALFTVQYLVVRRAVRDECAEQRRQDAGSVETP